MKFPSILALGLITGLRLAASQDMNPTTTTEPRNVRVDTGRFGPEVEEFHYFYDQWPIGLAVSKAGRTFVCYTRGSYAYTLGEVVNQTAEAAYPSLEYNTPSGSLSNQSDGITFGSNEVSSLISVQALYITPDDTLWVLDTGRPTVMDSSGNPTMPYAAPGGPKLVAINLSNNTVVKTYTFPPTVHFPDSYMNDLRFDMRSNATECGWGIAYIVDSSNEGRNGLIMLDLGTGESWRHLTQHPSMLRVFGDVPSYQGIPFYVRESGMNVGFQQEGLDGIELSLYGDVSNMQSTLFEVCCFKTKMLTLNSRMKVLYYSALTTDYLYSIETKYLRANPKNDTLSSIRAFNNVKNLGQRGGNANGFASDNLGNVYMLMPETNAIYIYNDTTLQAMPYVRDPRIIWPDSANVGFDGYIYFNINQLPYQPMWNDGKDLREYPGLILRSRLPNNATKSSILS